MIAMLDSSTAEDVDLASCRSGDSGRGSRQAGAKPLVGTIAMSRCGGRMRKAVASTGSICAREFKAPSTKVRDVGAFIGQEDGSWLLFREKDIVVLAFDRHAHVGPLLENLRFDGDRFSGALADEEGRVLVGTMRADRPNGAGVYRLDATGSLGKVLGGTGESCGMGFNVKGDALYWTCGTTRTICRCRYDVKRGAVSNRQVFHECGPEEGAPHGPRGR